MQPTFQSVIPAGVYDIKNLKRKLRANEAHKVNSPWNIAADFNIDMSFQAAEIAGMLEEYEADHHTGMDIVKMFWYPSCVNSWMKQSAKWMTSAVSVND